METMKEALKRKQNKGMDLTISIITAPQRKEDLPNAEEARQEKGQEEVSRFEGKAEAGPPAPDAQDANLAGLPVEAQMMAGRDPISRSVKATSLNKNMSLMKDDETEADLARQPNSLSKKAKTMELAYKKKEA